MNSKTQFIYYFIFTTIVLGIIESKLNGCQTVLKSMKNERVKVKGPCIANVPIQQMVKDYKVEDIKDKNKSSNNHFKRVCSKLYV